MDLEAWGRTTGCGVEPLPGTLYVHVGWTGPCKLWPPSRRRARHACCMLHSLAASLRLRSNDRHQPELWHQRGSDACAHGSNTPRHAQRDAWVPQGLVLLATAGADNGRAVPCRAVGARACVCVCPRGASAGLRHFLPDMEALLDSFLATQDLARSKLIFWLLDREPDTKEQLVAKYQSIRVNGQAVIEFRFANTTAMSMGTCLEGRPQLWHPPGAIQPLTKSDLLRLLLLHKYGGAWVDTDTVLLRVRAAPTGPRIAVVPRRWHDIAVRRAVRVRFVGERGRGRGGGTQLTFSPTPVSSVPLGRTCARPSSSLASLAASLP